MSLRILAFAVVFLLAVAPRGSSAQSNDSWASRTVIGTLPYNATEGALGSSGTAADDPDPACRYGSDTAIEGTAWYGYDTGNAPEYVNLSFGGSNSFLFLAMYTGAPGSFRLVTGACSRPSNRIGRLSGIRLAPNTSYSILIARRAFTAPDVSFAMAAAPQLLVTKTEDTRDGACDADCSLREAIDAANGGAAAVIVPAGTYTLTRAGTNEDGNSSGDLDATESMGIYGAGMGATRIVAGGIDRVLDLSPGNSERGRTYAIGDLTIANGSVSAGFSNDGTGGGLRMFSFFEHVGLERVAILDSSATSGGGGASLRSSATVRDSVLSGNSAPFGGGLQLSSNSDVKFEVTGTTSTGNFAQFSGGGMTFQGTVRVTQSTVAQNSTGGTGGGISVDGGTGVIVGSTIADNGAGAGIRFDSFTTANVLRNNIIARNGGGDCSSVIPIARSYNLIEADGCGTPGTGDVAGPNGLAAVPGNNGGPTRTYALLSGSAALDAGDVAGCTDAYGLPLANDQRGAGYARVVNGRCDIGALESPTVFPPGGPVLDPASDTGGFNNDGITNDSTPRVTGTCTTGTNIELDVDGVAAAPESVACTAGAYGWTATAAIADGTRTITARTLGAGGPSLPSPGLVLTIDTVGPAAPVITGPATAPGPTFTVTGTIGEGAGIVVLEGIAQACATSTVSAGPWSCDATIAGAGQHVLRAYAFDLAGNSGPIGADFTVTLPEDLFADGFE